jgi:hypothetical protein
MIKIIVENRNSICTFELFENRKQVSESDEQELFVTYHELIKPALLSAGFHRETIEEFFGV